MAFSWNILWFLGGKGFPEVNVSSRESPGVLSSFYTDQKHCWVGMWPSANSPILALSFSNKYHLIGIKINHQKDFEVSPKNADVLVGVYSCSDLHLCPTTPKPWEPSQQIQQLPSAGGTKNVLENPRASTDGLKFTSSFWFQVWVARVPLFGLQRSLRPPKTREGWNSWNPWSVSSHRAPLWAI